MNLLLAGGKGSVLLRVLLWCQETSPSQRLLLLGWLGQGQGSWLRMGAEHRSWSCIPPLGWTISTAGRGHPLLLSVPSPFNVHLYRFHKTLSHVSPAAGGQALGGIKLNESNRRTELKMSLKLPKPQVPLREILSHCF